ncbi:MAG: polyhydroxyalkanoate depolymerase [Kiloniellaceae bacterium]
MLYQLHEWQSAAATPLRLLVEAGHRVLRHPLAPAAVAPLGGMFAAAHTMFEFANRHHCKPGFDLDGVTIGRAETTVSEVAVCRRPFCTLLRFACERPAAAPKVLLVAPLAGHFAAQLRDMVAALLPAHDVYVTDWVDAREVRLSEGGFDLEDCIAYVRDFLRLLGPDLHVIAICQATVPVLAAVSLLAADKDPATPRSMVLLGGPIDTRTNPTAIDRMATGHSLSWFERTQIARVPSHYPGRDRWVHPGFIQRATFLASNVDRLTALNLRLVDSQLRGRGDVALACERFYEDYLSVMDLPAEFYLQTVRLVFQEHALPRGMMAWRGRKVDPAAIRDTALMTVEGGRDDVSGRGQTHAAHDLCPNIAPHKRRRHVAPEADHIDLFSGRCWAESILPQVHDFIHTREPGRAAPPRGRGRSRRPQVRRSAADR